MVVEFSLSKGASEPGLGSEKSVQLVVLDKETLKRRPSLYWPRDRAAFFPHAGPCRLVVTLKDFGGGALVNLANFFRTLASDEALRGRISALELDDEKTPRFHCIFLAVQALFESADAMSVTWRYSDGGGSDGDAAGNSDASTNRCQPRKAFKTFESAILDDAAGGSESLLYLTQKLVREFLSMREESSGLRLSVGSRGEFGVKTPRALDFAARASILSLEERNLAGDGGDWPPLGITHADPNLPSGQRDRPGRQRPAGIQTDQVKKIHFGDLFRPDWDDKMLDSVVFLEVSGLFPGDLRKVADLCGGGKLPSLKCLSIADSSCRPREFEAFIRWSDGESESRPLLGMDKILILDVTSAFSTWDGGQKLRQILGGSPEAASDDRNSEENVERYLVTVPDRWSKAFGRLSEAARKTHEEFWRLQRYLQMLKSPLVEWCRGE